MTDNAQEMPDVEALLKRSKTRANRLFYAVVALSAIIFIFFGGAIVDKVKATAAGVSGSFADAEQQNLLWRKNIRCVADRPHWVKAANNVLVDAKVCTSGDVLIHIRTAENEEIYKWVPVEDVIRPTGVRTADE